MLKETKPYQDDFILHALNCILLLQVIWTIISCTLAFIHKHQNHQNEQPTPSKKNLKIFKPKCFRVLFQPLTLYENEMIRMSQEWDKEIIPNKIQTYMYDLPSSDRALYPLWATENSCIMYIGCSFYCKISNVLFRTFLFVIYVSKYLLFISGKLDRVWTARSNSLEMSLIRLMMETRRKYLKTVKSQRKTINEQGVAKFINIITISKDTILMYIRHVSYTISLTISTHRAYSQVFSDFSRAVTHIEI